MSNPSPGTSHADEKALIRRAQDGDAAAMRALIDAHKDRLFSFVRRMVRDHHEAEDICQDAFLKAFRSLHTFSTKFRFSTWLFTIGYRVSLNRIRKKKSAGAEVDAATLSLVADDAGADRIESEEAAKVRERVWRAVDELSPPQRACIVLFYRQEMSCQDISRIVELPLATVKSHLHRGRLKLREMLEGMSEAEISRFRNLGGLAG